MHCAAMSGRLDLAIVLLMVGADHLIKNDDGKTALDIAKDNGYPALERLLYKYAERKRTRILTSTKVASLTALPDLSKVDGSGGGGGGGSGGSGSGREAEVKITEVQ